jgi:hypothetical protein
MDDMPVIFDFDGVIADTETLHFEASRLVLSARGVSLDQARYYTKYLGYNDAMMADAVAEDQHLFAAGADRSAFVEMDAPDMNRLFVPFTDATSNKETYGGGRYLELTRTPTGLYDLDFNRAYHPYCLFNPSFECPVPPRENRLMAAIRAGEKLGG